MIKYLMKRMMYLIPVLIIISMILFGMLHMMPGDPVLMLMPIDDNAQLKPGEFEKLYDETAKRFGFDKPVPVQYLNWVKNTLSGDLGYSTQKKMEVSKVIAQPLKNSVVLNVGATLISFVVSIVVGIKSAVRQGKFYDRLWQVLSMVGYSLPSFFIAMVLIFVFAQKLGWFPSSSIPPSSIFLADNGSWAYTVQWMKILVLPTITLTIGSFASTSRYVRNAMIEALSQDYIRTARSKGVSERKVIYSHAFRNALIPVVTVVAWGIAGMFGGAAITEQIFTFNGIGRYLVQGVIARDYSLVLAMNMFYTLLSLGANVMMDIGYALVDPRIKLS